MEQRIKTALAGISGTTFGQIQYKTEIKPSAKHKDKKLWKKTIGNIQLFNGVKNDIYLKAVQRTGLKIDQNQPVEDFVKSDTYFFHHSDCYSLTEHKVNGRKYLYCLFNSASSIYYIDSIISTIQEVAALTTPSVSKELLSPNKIVHNVTNDIYHSVHPRNIMLENIRTLKINGKLLVF